MRLSAIVLCLSVVAPAGARAEILDRVVASVGNIAITRSDIESELRLEQFMNGKPPSSAPEAGQLTEARDRLIQQLLLAQEAKEEGIDNSGPAAGAAQLLDQIRKLYPDEESYESALSATGLTEEQVLERLARHVSTLRLIDQRLRPNAWVEQSEIDAYYREELAPAYAKRNGTPAPPLEDVEDQIREILLEQKVDQLLEEWLKEIARRREVRLHSF